MQYLFEGIAKALSLISSLDPEVLSAVWVSLRTSVTAIAFASLIGVPIGFLVATHNFRGKRPVVLLLNTLMALPTVVVGLIVYSFLSRQGPLGPLGLLYTPSAMVVGQFILATPIVAALTLTAVQGIDPRVRQTAVTLGANRLQLAMTMTSEARFAITAAIIAGFGRIIAEVGSAMMLGGNIRGYTRTMTTTIALETSKGEFALGIALGVILLIVAFTVNILFQALQRRGI
ncbi:MAG: ABC transporter permease [Gemmatimonadota bacterium]|nr:MAG: ABC transporter permease [Gemmatimonadota bacterium]